jgi:PleD family two-component response regulator
MLERSVIEDGIHRANNEALICLKAKAYLDISERIANGSKEDSKQLRKHKGDIFRLAVMLAENDVFELPGTIKKQMQTFADSIASGLPDKTVFKTMGMGSISVEKVFSQILKSFQLNGE